MRAGGITAAWLRVLALACVVGAMVAEFSGGAGAARDACPNATVQKGQTGTWASQPAPEFPAGDPAIVAYAVDASDPRRRFVTNGTAILGSQDDGCSWKAVFVIADTPSQPAPYTRAGSRIAELAAAGGRAVASVIAPPPQEGEDTGPGDDPTRSAQLVSVLHSTPGDGNWRQSDLVPHAGEPGDIAFAPSDTKIVYVAAGSTILRSTDGGASFAPAAPVDATSLSIRTVAVDPYEPNHVFAASDRRVYRTQDGGQSWRQYSDQEKAAEAAIGPVIGREPGTPRKVTLVRTKFTTSAGPGGTADGSFDGLAISEDGGASFTAVPRAQAGEVSGLPLTAIGSDRREELIVTTAGTDAGGAASVFRRSPGSGRLVGVDEFHLAPLRAVHAESKGAQVHLFAADKLVSFQPAAGDLQPAARPATRPPVPVGVDQAADVDAPPVELKPLEDAKPPPAALSPRNPQVAVPVGETVTADFKLAVDPRPLPLDVFFLLDTSGSTDPYIKSLKDGLVQLAGSLNRAGVDPRFGLGEYNDTGREGGTTRYRRLADIGPADKLIEPLQRIRTAGGAEPGYTAAHQVASGSGISSNALPVPRGQQANWRTGSVRLVVQIADEPFSTDPVGASRDQAVAALRDRNIHLVGLQASKTPNALMPVLTDCGDGPDPENDVEIDVDGVLDTREEAELRCMLVDMARETRSFATRDIDCDGDRLPDVRQGEPLVCSFLQEDVLELTPEVATPVFELGQSLADRQPAELVAADSPVTVKIAPLADYDGLDLNARNELGFTVSFACKPEIRGRSFEVALQARVAGLVAAETAPVVVCEKAEPAIVPVPPARAAKVPKAKADPQPAAKPVIAAAPAPIVPATTAPQPPPPAPIPQFQSAQAAQPASAQASQPAQAQAGVPGTSAAAATRSEEAPAPILARVELNDDEGPASRTSFSFAAYEAPAANARDETAAWLIRFAGIAGVVGLAGSAMRPRQRRMPPTVTVSTRTPAPARRRNPRRRKRNSR